MKPSLESEITSILHSAPIVGNLARKTFVSLFIIALLKSRKVQFCEIATVLNDSVKTESNQNRIEDFFREVTLDFSAIGHLMVALLPKKSKLRLTIDRTEWDFAGPPVRQMSGEYFNGFGRMWRFTVATLLGVTR